VLLLVLCWLAILMFIATQLIAATRVAVAVSINIRGSAVAEALADGAVNEAIFQVLARHWKADGAVHFVKGSQAIAEVRIDDEGGKIDPNVAPPALVQALLHECGAAPKPAGELAAAILEWRSLDMLRLAGTDSAPRYRAVGAGYLPPHARFASVDELALVLGMTPALFGCLEPHLSIYSLSVPALETTADPVVRRALLVAYPFEAPQTVAVPAHEVAVIRVTALSRQTGGSRFRRVAVVRIAPAEPSEDFIYKVLAWEGSAG
jgi:general secretion pathway protein K